MLYLLYSLQNAAHPYAYRQESAHRVNMYSRKIATFIGFGAGQK